MTLQRIGYRSQRTLKRPADIDGIGFISGADVRVRFVPAEPDTGLVFVRTDLKDQPHIRAEIGQVSGTKRRTTLGSWAGQVTLVEHVLAALNGLRIDNCRIELDGPEPPGLDGSAQSFVQTLIAAETETQSAKRAMWSPVKPICVRGGGATLSLHPLPGDELRISYLLDYGPRSPIERQMHTQSITVQNFINEIASCRTFLLDSEVDEFRQQGIGKRTTTKDLLVFGPRGVIDNRVRFADEPSRHKILDVLGDLALCGIDIRGHIVAYRSGHPLNVELARTLDQALAAPLVYSFRRAA